ncbi:phage tail tube protein [Zavarzinella formosa]|uniref:phage tail tube protein n=1 Tax=Zavarzinella formosa TaxID=360055 RepID=UPI0002F294D5|nr:phage tail tube protein [Zavarzinella formosa]
MTAQKGNSLLLKAGAVAASPVTVAGLRNTSLKLSNSMVDVTNKDSAGYRTLLQGAGEQSVTISADGTADSAAAFSTLQNNAFNNTISTYCLFFDNGDTLECSFQITSFEVSGTYNKEQLFTCTLESSGQWTFTNN